MVAAPYLPPPFGPLSPTALKRIEAWLALPEEDGAELLGGRVVYKGMASLEHGDAILGISEQIGLLRGPRREGRGGWWQSHAPDRVCEVLSESTRGRDEAGGVKWRTCWEAGVAHDWLVDLVGVQVTVYARGVRDFEPLDIAGASSKKPLAPFAEVDFDAARVFILAVAARGG